MAGITLERARKVTDAGNNLTSFARQDGAWLGSIDIAQGKAYSARAFDMTSAELGAEAQPGKSLYGIEDEEVAEAGAAAYA